MTIIVNARQHTLPAKYKSLTHEQIVMLAFGPVGDSVTTITYSKGPARKPQGSVTSGESVRLKNGMIFNAVSTNKA